MGLLLSRLLSLLWVVALAACGVAPSGAAVPSAPPLASSSGTAYPLTVVDGAGRQVRLEHAPQHIVSYQPSNTETLFALGVGDRIVGTDTYSDYPAEAQAKPKLGGLQVNLEALVALQPDLVVTTGPKPDFATLLEPQHIPVLVLAYNDLPGTLANMGLLGQVVGKPAEAAALTARIRDRVEAVQAKTRAAPPVRVYYELDGSDPSRPHTAGPGSFINDLLVMAGGSNIAAGTTSPFPQISAEEVVRANPELIIVPIEGPPSPEATNPERFRQRPGWAGIAAVQAGAIRSVESRLVSRPGPRLVDALDALAKVTHPELFL